MLWGLERAVSGIDVWPPFRVACQISWQIQQLQTMLHVSAEYPRQVDWDVLRVAFGDLLSRLSQS